MFNRIDNFFSKLPFIFLEFFSFLLIMLVALLDYLSGAELSFALFYLIPVAFSVWYLRLHFGLLVCVVSAVTWFSIDSFLSGSQYSHPSIPFWNTGVRLGFFIIVTLLLERLQKDLELQEFLARNDGLTGLMNGRSFKQESSNVFELAARHKHSATLAYIDLDGFKGINDTLGHSVGDSVLKTVADIIAKRLRKSDFGARMGGDEFAVLLPETNLEGAKTFFTDLQSALLAEMKNNHWEVGFSVGVAVLHSPSNNIDESIHCADSLMYYVKKSGKNRILFEEYGVKA